jgi:hypothetical protein
MIVSVVNGTLNGLRNATHVGIPRVGPTGEGASGFKKVYVSILGHFEPVDSMNEFPPAENLSDESLYGVQGCFALTIGFFCGVDALLWREEA